MHKKHENAYNRQKLKMQHFDAHKKHLKKKSLVHLFNVFMLFYAHKNV